MTKPTMTWARSLVAAVALGISLIPAHAADTLPPARPLKLPQLNCEKYVMPNGLTVLLHEDHRLPLVAIDLWYHVGPLNERAGRTGFAHLFEHMMFEGSEHVGEKAHVKYVQAAGATDVNGTTSFDRTNYFETMPSNQVELGLWLESDRMGFLLEGLDRVKLANQRDVVRNERRQGEGRPYEVADERVYELLFPKEHPYYADVIGSHADIEAARIADIREFHQQYYTPNNASIAIAGDFKPAEIKALLTKYFGPIPKGPDVPPVTATTPVITSQKRDAVTDTVKLPQMRIAFLTPARFTTGDADAQIIAHILGGGRTSRLNKILVYDKQVAQSANCDSDSLKLTGMVECDITAKPGIKLEDLEAMFWEQLGKLQSEGPTAAEVEAARTLDLTRKINGLQRLGGFGGVADTLDEYNQYTGDPGYLSTDIAHYQAVTAASAKSAASTYLTKDHSVVVYCVPGAKVVSDVPRSPDNTDAEVKLTAPYPDAFETEQNWRNTAPAAGPPLTFHLPVPKTFALKNGLQVYLAENPNLPLMTAALVSRAGGEANPADKAGLATFTAAMLTEGTATRSRNQLAEDAEKIGGQIDSAATMDQALARISVLSNNSDAAIDLLADTVEHPAFHPEDVERLRKMRLVGIQQEGDSVSAILNRVAPHVLYGDQPYGLAGTGTLDSVKSISPEDLSGFWSSHYGPSDSALILSGDLTEKDARRLAEQYFGSWTGAAKGEVTLPPAPTPPTRKVVLVDKPGSPQTALFAWGLGVAATSPDLQTIEVMNYTLGGSFGSRINMNLREVHGYTYGANSLFYNYREGGPFAAGGLVRTDVTAAAAKELMMELTRIPTDPPTADELKAAKQASIQSLPGQFTTTLATTTAMARLFIYKRPTDYYATLPAKFQSVTPGDVARVAKEDVRPDQMVLMAVGDKAKIETGLKDLNIGPIEYRDASGNILK